MRGGYVEELARQIILRALLDYRFLVDSGKQESYIDHHSGCKTPEFKCGVSEIEDFILSEWCSDLFRFLGYPSFDKHYLLGGMRVYKPNSGGVGVNMASDIDF